MMVRYLNYALLHYTLKCYSIDTAKFRVKPSYSKSDAGYFIMIVNVQEIDWLITEEI